MSKFATEGLAQVLAHETEGTEVRVNIMDPGKARTAMRRQAYPSEAPESADGRIAGGAVRRAARTRESAASRDATSRRRDLAGSQRRRAPSSTRRLLRLELAELAACQCLVELPLTDDHAQHPAHQGALALEQLADILAARRAPDRYQRFGAFGSASLCATISTTIRVGRSSLPLCTPSSWSGPNKPLHTHAEYTRQAWIGALQFGRERAVGGHELEAAVDPASDSRRRNAGPRLSADDRQARRVRRRPRAAGRRAND